jgi:hypothetical protein
MAVIRAAPGMDVASGMKGLRALRRLRRQR